MRRNQSLSQRAQTSTARPEVVETLAVPLAPASVHRPLEEEDGGEGEEPDRRTAQEEQPERGRGAAHAETLAAPPGRVRGDGDWAPNSGTESMGTAATIAA